MPHLLCFAPLALLLSLAPGAFAAPDLAEVARQVVERSNAARREHGLSPTTPQPQLSEAARAFASYMARTDRYSHRADGREPSQRATAQGYDYCMVAENIAYQFHSAGFATAELARGFVRGWLNSPEHRRNLLEPDAVHTGVAVAQSPRTGRYYAVQMFGRPQSMQVEFRLSNRSPGAVSYELDGKSYQLPPHSTDTHRQCSAPRLSVQLPGERDVTLQPAHGERYAIERVAGRYRVRRSRRQKVMA